MTNVTVNAYRLPVVWGQALAVHLGGSPGHGEKDVQRDAQRISNMHMRIANRVGYQCICLQHANNECITRLTTQQATKWVPWIPYRYAQYPCQVFQLQ